jgi:hypothetical protein
MQFVSPNVGWILGINMDGSATPTFETTVLLATTDGGATWKTLSPVIGP